MTPIRMVNSILPVPGSIYNRNIRSPLVCICRSLRHGTQSLKFYHTTNAVKMQEHRMWNLLETGRNNDPPGTAGGYFIFGHSPNTISGAHVRSSQPTLAFEWSAQPSQRPPCLKGAGFLPLAKRLGDSKPHSGLLCFAQYPSDLPAGKGGALSVTAAPCHLSHRERLWNAKCYPEPPAQPEGSFTKRRARNAPCPPGVVSITPLS